MKRHYLAPLAVLAAMTLTACSGGDPTTSSNTTTDTAAAGDTIVIGTANFPESEIIGNIWADVLTNAGYNVEMKNRIGSREVYLSALDDGTINIIPEYSGNLAEYFIKTRNGEALPSPATPEQVEVGLAKVLPDGIVAGKTAPAESKDSFRVTKDFAKKHNLATIGDLATLPSFTLAANPEIAERPFGPAGLERTYGIAQDNIKLTPISDSGGPLTVKALRDGSVDVANVYTTSPALDEKGNEVELVTLDDPAGLILPQNVLPLMRKDAVPEKAQKLLDDINSKLTTQALYEMNLENIGPKKKDAAAIAEEFTAANPVAGQ